MTAPAVPEERTVALRVEELNPAQIDLIKTTYAKGATDDELKLFVAVCNALQLNPFIGQIHAVKRWSSADNKMVMAYQTGIGGFRLQAQRSKARGGPEYRGQTEPMWCDDKGNWTDLWLKDEPPFAAKVGVYVEGFVDPIYAIAEYKRLVQTTKEGKPNIFWAKGSPFQLAKCAEAAAIRRAFPGETSRLYLEEEMYQMPEEKDITPPMSIEDHKKALAPPPVQPGPQTKDPDPPDPPTPDPPKGEEIVSPERREQVIAHLQGITVQERPPQNMTEIEAGLLLACKQGAKANRVLDTMATHRDTQGKIL